MVARSMVTQLEDLRTELEQQNETVQTLLIEVATLRENLERVSDEIGKKYQRLREDMTSRRGFSDIPLFGGSAEDYQG